MPYQGTESRGKSPYIIHHKLQMLYRGKPLDIQNNTIFYPTQVTRLWGNRFGRYL